MTDVKLKEVRSSIAVCSVDEGSTLEARQEANAKRRSLYARLDGYRSELEKLQVEAQAAGDDIAEIEELRREVEDLVSTLVIKPVQNKSWPLLNLLDFLWKAPAVFLFVLFMGFVTSVPLILLTMLEHRLFLLRRGLSQSQAGLGTAPCKVTGGTEPLKSGPALAAGQPPQASMTTVASTVGDEAAAWAGACARQAKAESGSWSGGLSSMVKRFDAWWMLLIMGVNVQEEGLRECSLSRPAMLLFSHVSTLDAMIILGTFPRALCAVVKEELFALPIVGWIMASHGGVPINRRNRASAVQVLAEAGDRARDLELFVAMAPEGTRSKTGQLGPFKKGALHMQEQLQWPVIPVTIRGAYELFPLKSYSNQCGKVVVRFHKPIQAWEIESRDGLARRLRKEMFQAVEEPATEAGRPLTPFQRAMSFAAVATTYWASGQAATLVRAFARREGVAMWALLVGGFAYIVLSTVFVYYVYARRWLSGRGRTKRIVTAAPVPRACCAGASAGDGRSTITTAAGEGVTGEMNREQSKVRRDKDGQEEDEAAERLLGADSDLDPSGGKGKD